MPFSTSTELLTWLSDNLFLNPQQVDELRPGVATNPDLHAFCKELLRRSWLTPYQVNQLLKNNGDGLVVGANRIHSRLGEGAMGQVLRAWNVRLGRMVAVKMLHADHSLSGKAMDRFRREMQTAAALVHPNIVLLRDADEANNVPYLVMDYFDSIDLSRKMREEGPQPIKQAVEYVRQAAVGLQHAFELGVVHRDIKPSNMLLVKGADGAPVVKILDFGLAKFEREADGQQPLTQAGRLIGTVDYIAPEQALDAHNADIRADIYSLGCTLYYFLTGKAPFPGNDHLEKLSARIQGTPPRVRQIRADVPQALEDVLLKMMARDPAQRFQTPLEVVNALTPFTRDVPAAAPVAAPVAAVLQPGVAAIVAQPVAGKAPLAVAVPTAQPQAVALEESGPQFTFTNTNGSFSDGSEHVDTMSDVASPTRKRTPSDDFENETTGRGISKPLLFSIAGVILVLLISTIVFVFWRPEKIEPAILGTMSIQLDSPPDRVWAHGERKPVIVKISRQKFNGPVTVGVEACPKWLECQPIKIAPNKVDGELRFIVKYGDFEGPASVRIVANSPESQPASVGYDMDVVAVRGRKPKLPTD